MSLPDSAQPVAAWLAARGHGHAPRLLDASARTAQEAADALGVQLGQIAKSIVFRRLPDNAAVMVVTSGDQRVDEKKLAALACAPGQKLGRADPDFVRERTGFAIGGVSPVAHASALVQVLDLSLFRFEQVWAAAGHPHAVFAAAPAQLALLTQARLDDVASSPLAPAARALALLRARAACVQAAPAGDPPSPCISVCRMDEASGLCVGCLRSLDEIAAWSSLSPPARRGVWQAIAERAAVPV
ncbi:MAG: YbaK/EbsC family protein [Betaproteobacteria bacterium]